MFSPIGIKTPPLLRRTWANSICMGLAQKLQKGEFVITTEITPPKGTDLGHHLRFVESLRGKVDAINVTDNARAHVKSHPLPLCVKILEQGIEPICQFTCRDRNRIALQSDLLAAGIFGVKNILALGGDPVHVGDHPEAKPVFDMDVMSLLETARSLREGKDLKGNELEGTPEFHIGAATNPCVDDVETEISKCKKKIEQGAEFFQTQAIYDLEKFERFCDLYKKAGLKAPIIAGIIPLKSAKMARFMNEKVPGISIPAELIEELETSEDPKHTGRKQAVSVIQHLRFLCAGIHIMPVGNEENAVALLHEIQRKI